MEIICVDTNLLIDYFRKKDKLETRLYKLSRDFLLAIPTVAAYEFLRGQTNQQPDQFLSHLLTKASTLPFDFACAQKAAAIYQSCKPINCVPEPEDLLIAATALAWGYPLATNNRKHFEHIPDIQLILWH